MNDPSVQGNVGNGPAGSGPSNDRGQGEEPRVVIRDRRRIDPETGQVRLPNPAEQAEAGRHAAPDQPAPGAPGIPGGGPVVGAVDGLLAELQDQLDERTSDLQRLTAEYANYRKRVDRDRAVVVASARAQVVGELVPVLDDIERAAVHGDLTGAFKAVADKLVDAVSKVGLEPFGHEGEPFDPSVHEAVQHATSPEVAGPTVTAVLRRGYRVGERLVRPALVGVTDHEAAPADGPVEQN